MNYLLSVDPGLRKCGVALWRDGELVAARLVVGITSISGSASLETVILAMVDAVGGFADPALGTSGLYRGKLAIEYPRTYGGRSNRGDANDLISVALVAGAILGRLGCPSRLLLPEEWKGGIPKPASKAEYERDGYVVETRARAKLSTAELARVEWGKDWKKRMDVSDALGIGLFAIGR